MPALPHNIDRSAFHRGEYVGYADGPWRIRARADSVGGWIAHKRDGGDVLYGRTLADVSEGLSLHNRAAASARYRARLAGPLERGGNCRSGA